MNKIVKVILFLVLGASVFTSCNGERVSDVRKSEIPQKNSGPKTVNVLLKNYSKIFYVSSEEGSDDDGNGSVEKPWRSPDFAISQINDATENSRCAVLVSVGEYSNNTIQLKEYVDLFGGFSGDNWKRDIYKFPSYLSGEGRRRVLIGANFARVDGFVIYAGQIRGKGAGLYCEGTSPTLSNNIFWRNKTLKPIPWKPKFMHETANDGAAIYLLNESSAEITNNLFIENSTENGRGAGIAIQTRCNPLILENVFLNNVTGLDDPMRSSDGGAISVFDWCNARIENNIVLSNKALASNDAGGIFIALWSSAIVKGNLFIDNDAGDDAGGLFVGGQEHRYDSPLDPIPPKDKFFVDVNENIFLGNKNSSMNSGAMRFTMESRGIFQRNITAFNNGIYFQRSEVKVSENIILDDFLFIETKEGLKKGEISNNLIWARYDLQIGADVHNNHIKGKSDQGGYVPDFIKDDRELIAGSVIYQRKQFVTEVILVGVKLKQNELANRVVRAGKTWGVIQKNDTGTLTIWGNFTGEMVFNVLPTYTLR